MRTVHRLVVLIAIVAGSLYPVKHVAAAEVDVTSTSSCDAGLVFLNFIITNNSTMSITVSLPPLAPITIAAGATETGSIGVLTRSIPSYPLEISYTRQDGTRGTTSVTLHGINCGPGRVYLPLVEHPRAGFVDR